MYNYANSNLLGVAHGNETVTSMGNCTIASTNSEKIYGSQTKQSQITNSLSVGSTIHSLYTSISGLVNHSIYFVNNMKAFSDDMAMIGASIKDAVLAYNNFGWGLGKSDLMSIGLGVGIDIYNNIQNGANPISTITGATLTAAKGVGLVYLNKGIMYGATTLGSAISPGAGTVVGFVCGGIVCIIVDVFSGNFLDELINMISQ